MEVSVSASKSSSGTRRPTSRDGGSGSGAVGCWARAWPSLRPSRPRADSLCTEPRATPRSSAASAGEWWSSRSSR
ncbi:MAG: hypothetical protein ACK559_23035 [bacterium]